MPVVGGYEGMMESQKHDMGQLLSAIGGASKIQDMELHGDRARLLRAQAGLAENELTQEQAFAQAMSGMAAQPEMPERQPDGKPASRAAPLFQMADVALRAGAVKKGQELLSKASTIEHQESQDRMGDQKLAYYRRKDAEADLERLGGFYGDVKSQEDLDAANAAFQQVYPDRPLPQWAGAPYSPFLIKGFKDSLLTEQQRLAAINRDEDQKAREEDQRLRKDREARVARLAEEAERRRREKDGAVAKAGGGKVALTVGKDLPVLAAREISDSIFGGEIPPEFRKEVESAKVVIAARAKQLLEGNRGLDLAAATARAVQESREAGEWTDTEVTRENSWYKPNEKIAGKKFKARSAEPRGDAKPLPLPASRSEWKVGGTYVGKNGKVGKWNGTAFEVQ